ncbi:hypothetical protein ACHAXT_008375 [Thalassiosira profunda]
MSAFRNGRGARTPASLRKAHKLGIRTSEVSAWSRSHSFNYAVRATVVLVAIIVGNGLMSITIVLSQIDFRGKKYVPYTRAVGTVPTPSIEDVCSAREKSKLKGDLDNHFGSSSGEKYSFAVVVTVNNGFGDFFLNWLGYFRERVEGKSENPLLIIVAEDAAIHKRLKKLNRKSTVILPGYKSSGDSVIDRAEDYDSQAYKSLVSTRATHLLDLICSLRGESTPKKSGSEGEATKTTGEDMAIVYSDVDTVWLKDPFPYFQAEMFGSGSNATQTQQRTNFDILAAVDDHDYMEIDNYYCTGLLVIAQTPASVAFISRWEKELISSSQLNQPIFNTLLRSDELPEVRHGGLDETAFPPGRLYFDEWVMEGGETERQKKKNTMVVHNNYIVGHDAKKERFQEHKLWKGTR